VTPTPSLLAPEVRPASPPAKPDKGDTGRVGHIPIQVKPRRRGTSPLWLGVPLAVIGGLFAIVYLPSRSSTVGALSVKSQVARAETVVRWYPSAAPLRGVEPVKFSFAEGGKVAELLPPGQQVKSGDSLAKLDGYVKLEKQLGEIRGREVFYQGELDKAERAGNGPAVAQARAKVQEKRSLIAGLQAKYARLVLSATTPGTVGENLAKVGDGVEAGQPVTTLSQLRLRVDFVMPKDVAGSLKTGMIGRLAREDGKLVDCRIEKVEEEGAETTVRAEVMDVASGVKSGERVRLVRSRFEGVIRLPTQSVVRAAGSPSLVYVVQGGKAQQRAVTILDKNDTEVLVGQGVAPGEHVVTSGAMALHDGSRVESN
jgi:RND family efflux transporter MFP subunit